MSSQPERTLAHYRLIEKIGEGGMGIVYRAEDTALKRSVALKFLTEESMNREDRRARFLREARLAASLNHPSICTIYAVGEVQPGEHQEPLPGEELKPGTPFIAMECIEGKTLAERLHPKKSLPLGDLLQIGQQLAEGLAAAHARGIIHRDLKPGNVMLTTDGRAKILDFGLAKPLGKLDLNDQPISRARTISHELTREGMVVGTAAYMSPEQARGERLDARSDIFSLGVVLYQMATGRLPFSGATRAERISAILRDTPPPVTRVQEDLPRHLERIITHCLEKEPQARFQSARDVYNELRSLHKEVGPEAEVDRSLPGRWVGVGGGLAVIAIALALWNGWDPLAPVPGQGAPGDAVDLAAVPWVQHPDVASIAVLPFADRSPGGDQEYFADGLAEELLNALARVHGLRVAARTASFSFKGKDAKVVDIGRDLNVASILEGSVRKAGTRLRVTIQLVNVADGFSLWSNAYDRNLDDIFAVQEEIAREVVTALKGEFLAEDAKAWNPRAANSEAFNLYLQGQFFSKGRTQEDLEKAITYFQLALERDASYAPAWSGLADAYNSQADNGWVPFEEGYSRALQAAQRALELDPDMGLAHATIGWIKMFHDWDWKAADTSLKRALELEPGEPAVLTDLALLATILDRLDEAIVFARRSVELDPLDPIGHSNLGLHFLFAGRLKEAESALRRAVELDMRSVSAHVSLGWVHLEQGRPEAALMEMERETHPALRAFGLALAYHALGRQQEADSAVDQFIEEFGNEWAYQVAQVRSFRGETDKAFEWLERAYEVRDPGIVDAKVNPLLDSLHDDPRWEAFLQKMDL